ATVDRERKSVHHGFATIDLAQVLDAQHHLGSALLLGTGGGGGGGGPGGGEKKGRPEPGLEHYLWQAALTRPPSQAPPRPSVPGDRAVRPARAGRCHRRGSPP